MPFDPDRLNIYELVIEEPEKEKQSELPFDVERDITDEEWDRFKADMDQLRKSNEWSYLGQKLAHLKILDPQRLPLLEENLFSGMQEKRNHYSKSSFGGGDFLSVSCKLKSLFPERNLNFSPVEMEKMKYSVETNLANENWGNYALEFSVFKVVSPDNGLKYDSRAMEENEKQLESFRKEKDWWNFCYLGANIRIIDPSHDFKLDKADWEDMLQFRNSTTGQHIDNLFAHFANMQVLAAEKVEVTDNGLELTMSKPKQKLDTGVPPLPETKNF